jgi:hypothetical protein
MTRRPVARVTLAIVLIFVAPASIWHGDSPRPAVTLTLPRRSRRHSGLRQVKM